jgi:hypothetical protein
VEIEGDTLSFYFKSHLIHEAGRYHFVPRWHEQVRPQFEVDCLFWSGAFTYREVVFSTEAEAAENIASFRRRFRHEEVLESARLRVLLYLIKFPLRLAGRRRIRLVGGQGKEQG